MIKQGLFETSEPIRHEEESDGNALCQLAWEGKVKELKELLRSGSDPNARNAARFTPLHCACEFGRLGCVAQLVEYGADIEYTNRKDGWSALHWAAFNGQVKVVKLLLKKGADANLKDKIGMLPGDRFDIEVPAAEARRVRHLLKAARRGAFKRTSEANTLVKQEAITIQPVSNKEPHIFDLRNVASPQPKGCILPTAAQEKHARSFHSEGGGLSLNTGIASQAKASPITLKIHRRSLVKGPMRGSLPHPSRLHVSKELAIHLKYYGKDITASLERSRSCLSISLDSESKFGLDIAGSAVRDTETANNFIQKDKAHPFALPFGWVSFPWLHKKPDLNWSALLARTAHQVTFKESSGAKPRPSWLKQGPIPIQQVGNEGCPPTSQAKDPAFMSTKPKRRPLVRHDNDNNAECFVLITRRTKLRQSSLQRKQGPWMRTGSGSSSAEEHQLRKGLSDLAQEIIEQAALIS